MDSDLGRAEFLDPSPTSADCNEAGMPWAKRRPPTGSFRLLRATSGGSLGRPPQAAPSGTSSGLHSRASPSGIPFGLPPSLACLATTHPRSLEQYYIVIVERLGLQLTGRSGRRCKEARQC